MTSKFVILVGHGGVPSDCPPGLVGEFKRLEAAGGKPSAQLAEIDARVRSWPRTPKTDPYKAGLETVASALRLQLPEHRVIEAYNEFCAPSLEEAAERAVKLGAQHITVISTMYTRGGVHSESDIPAALAKLRLEHPKIKFSYAWPFDINAVAGMLAGEVRRTEN